MQSLRAEYSEPSKGRGEKVRVIKRSPRAGQFQRVGPGANAFRRCPPRACGTTPPSPFFLGRVCDAGTEEARREAH